MRIFLYQNAPDPKTSLDLSKGVDQAARMEVLAGINKLTMKDLMHLDLGNLRQELGGSDAKVGEFLDAFDVDNSGDATEAELQAVLETDPNLTRMMAMVQAEIAKHMYKPDGTVRQVTVGNNGMLTIPNLEGAQNIRSKVVNLKTLNDVNMVEYIRQQFRVKNLIPSGVVNSNNVVDPLNKIIDADEIENKALMNWLVNDVLGFSDDIADAVNMSTDDFADWRENMLDATATTDAERLFTYKDDIDNAVITQDDISRQPGPRTGEELVSLGLMPEQVLWYPGMTFDLVQMAENIGEIQVDAVNFKSKRGFKAPNFARTTFKKLDFTQLDALNGMPPNEVVEAIPENVYISLRQLRTAIEMAHFGDVQPQGSLKKSVQKIAGMFKGDKKAWVRDFLGIDKGGVFKADRVDEAAFALDYWGDRFNGFESSSVIPKEEWTTMSSKLWETFEARVLGTVELSPLEQQLAKRGFIYALHERQAHIIAGAEPFPGIGAFTQWKENQFGKGTDKPLASVKLPNAWKESLMADPSVMPFFSNMIDRLTYEGRLQPNNQIASRNLVQKQQEMQQKLDDRKNLTDEVKEAYKEIPQAMYDVIAMAKGSSNPKYKFVRKDMEKVQTAEDVEKLLNKIYKAAEKDYIEKNKGAISSQQFLNDYPELYAEMQAKGLDVAYTKVEKTWDDVKAFATRTLGKKFTRLSEDPLMKHFFADNMTPGDEANYYAAMFKLKGMPAATRKDNLQIMKNEAERAIKSMMKGNGEESAFITQEQINGTSGQEQANLIALREIQMAQIRAAAMKITDVSDSETVTLEMLYSLEERIAEVNQTVYKDSHYKNDFIQYCMDNPEFRLTFHDWLDTHSGINGWEKLMFQMGSILNVPLGFFGSSITELFPEWANFTDSGDTADIKANSILEEIERRTNPDFEAEFANTITSQSEYVNLYNANVGRLNVNDNIDGIVVNGKRVNAPVDPFTPADAQLEAQIKILLDNRAKGGLNNYMSRGYELGTLSLIVKYHDQMEVDASGATVSFYRQAVTRNNDQGDKARWLLEYENPPGSGTFIKAQGIDRKNKTKMKDALEAIDGFTAAEKARVKDDVATLDQIKLVDNPQGLADFFENELETLNPLATPIFTPEELNDKRMYSNALNLAYALVRTENQQTGFTGPLTRKHARLFTTWLKENPDATFDMTEVNTHASTTKNGKKQESAIEAGRRKRSNVKQVLFAGALKFTLLAPVFYGWDTVKGAISTYFKSGPMAMEKLGTALGKAEMPGQIANVMKLLVPGFSNLPEGLGAAFGLALKFAIPVMLAAGIDSADGFEGMTAAQMLAYAKSGIVSVGSSAKDAIKNAFSYFGYKHSLPVVDHDNGQVKEYSYDSLSNDYITGKGVPQDEQQSTLLKGGDDLYYESLSGFFKNQERMSTPHYDDQVNAPSAMPSIGLAPANSVYTRKLTPLSAIDATGTAVASGTFFVDQKGDYFEKVGTPPSEKHVRWNKPESKLSGKSYVEGGMTFTLSVGTAVLNASTPHQSKMQMPTTGAQVPVTSSVDISGVEVFDLMQLIPAHDYKINFEGSNISLQKTLEIITTVRTKTTDTTLTDEQIERAVKFYDSYLNPNLGDRAKSTRAFFETLKDPVINKFMSESDTMTDKLLGYVSGLPGFQLNVTTSGLNGAMYKGNVQFRTNTMGWVDTNSFAHMERDLYEHYK